jgi:serine phosphatase RsbU (regulator of sigma subunit)
MIRNLFKYKESDVAFKFGINRAYLLSAALLFFLVRIAGDTLFLLTGFFDGSSLIVWKTITSLVVFGSLALYIFSEKRFRPEGMDTSPVNNYLNEYLLITILLIGVIILNSIMPEAVTGKWKPGDLFLMLYSEFITAYTVVVAILFLRFIYKWLINRRHKQTKLFLKILLLLLIYVTLSGLTAHIFEFRNSGIYSASQTIAILTAAIIMAIAARKNTWIALLERNHKVRLLWISLLAMMSSMAGIIMQSGSDSKLLLALHSFMPGVISFVELSTLLFGVYSLRVFFASVAALPTSDIVERRTSEISSLTYLNRYIAASINSDNSYLIDTVTKLALQSSGAVAAWTELYEEDGGETLCCPTPNINETRLKGFKEKNRVRNKLRQLDKTLLIESVPEHPEFSYLQRNIPFANSMIVVPLFSGEEKIGNLYVIHSDEFGFEQDDVKVLSAFSDNVSIALENSRLVKESIEKEHYKRELMLAREMQKKLLPQHLPVTKNFTLGAFSLPAEEVGGDYYEICRLADGNICMLIGDVSGKGMTAAFYMAQLKGTALSHAPETSDPRELLIKINATMQSSMEKQMFITLSALTINPETQIIKMARAGHMPAFVRKGNEIEVIRPNGLGIGLVAPDIFDEKIEMYSSEFHPGDACLMFTDGVNELRNSAGTDFGYQPLEEILIDDKFKSANELVNNVKKRLNDFSNGTPPHDDMTVVAVLCNNNIPKGAE